MAHDAQYREMTRLTVLAVLLLVLSVFAAKPRPFFLYDPTLIPHVALHVPDEELKPYLALKWNDPPFTREGGRGYTPHFTPRAAYAASSPATAASRRSGSAGSRACGRECRGRPIPRH